MTGRPTAPPNAARVTYDATDNRDGTYTIHDVPICGELAAGERGNVDAIGKDWMEGAIAHHLGELVAGFVSPVHAGHNKLTESPALGTFVPMATRRVEIGGVEQWCLFADMTVDQATLDSIREGRFPYRSIEVNWDSGYIGSLALLAGVSPHFRFPMLREIRVLNAGPVEVPQAAAVTLSAIASAALRTHRAKSFVPASVAMRHRSLTRLEYAEAGDEDEDGPDGKDKDTDGPPKKGGDEDAAGESESGSVMKAIAGFGTILERILQAVTGSKTEDRLQPARDEHPEDSGEASADGDADESDDDDEQDGGKKPRKETQMTAQTAQLDAATKAKLEQLDALAGKVTELTASVTALQAENSTLKAEAATAKKTAARAAGKARLSAKKIVVPADFDARFDRAYAADPALAEDVVAMLEQSGRKDPPENFHQAMHLDGVAGDEPEVAALAAKGTSALEQGRAAQAEWRAMRARGSEVTLAEHLKYRVKVPA